jgi:hypothetical protein
MIDLISWLLFIVSWRPEVLTLNGRGSFFSTGIVLGNSSPEGCAPAISAVIRQMPTASKMRLVKRIIIQIFVILIAVEQGWFLESILRSSKGRRYGFVGGGRNITKRKMVYCEPLINNML